MQNFACERVVTTIEFFADHTEERRLDRRLGLDGQRVLARIGDELGQLRVDAFGLHAVEVNDRLFLGEIDVLLGLPDACCRQGRAVHRRLQLFARENGPAKIHGAANNGQDHDGHQREHDRDRSAFVPGSAARALPYHPARRHSALSMHFASDNLLSAITGSFSACKQFRSCANHTINTWTAR